MSMLSGVSDFFGLDLGVTALRVVQLHGSGSVRSLGNYGFMPMAGNLALSDSKADQQKLASYISELLKKTGINSKNVAVGIPTNQAFTAVFDMDKLSPAELGKTIQYQADSMIPTPPSESKIDWALLGDSPKDPTKVEILLSSISNNYVETRLDMLESIGLNVISFEPDAMALARAVISPDDAQAVLVLDIGSKSTDLVIVSQGLPRLIRAIPTGSEAIIRSAVQNLSIDEKQAEQFVFKFGLSKDKLEGQIHGAIIGIIDILMAEVEKSIKFYQTRYAGSNVSRIVVTGGASVLPEFPLYIANKVGISVEIGNAWANVTFPANKQNDLLAVSNHFAVAVGLAEREE